MVGLAGGPAAGLGQGAGAGRVVGVEVGQGAGAVAGEAGELGEVGAAGEVEVVGVVGAAEAEGVAEAVVAEARVGQGVHQGQGDQVRPCLLTQRTTPPTSLRPCSARLAGAEAWDTVLETKDGTKLKMCPLYTWFIRFGLNKC